jgi:hypothetical protein
MQAERLWREEWAAYFDLRAAKSEANAAVVPAEAAQSWMHKAAGERECAVMLRSGETLESLYAALQK